MKSFKVVKVTGKSQERRELRMGEGERDPKHGSRKGFSGGSQKIIVVYSGSHLATGAARSAAEGFRLGSGGSTPVVVQENF